MSLSTIDLTLRSETTVPLTTTQHDANLTTIQTAINAIVASLNTLNANVETYGEMYQAGNASATTVTLADTYYTVGNFSAGHLDTITFASNALTLTTAGDYLVSASISFSGTTGDTIKFAFAIDGTADANHVVERKLGSGDVGACSLLAIVEATAGQAVTLVLQNDGTNNVTVKDCTVFVRKIH